LTMPGAPAVGAFALAEAGPEQPEGSSPGHLLSLAHLASFVCLRSSSPFSHGPSANRAGQYGALRPFYCSSGSEASESRRGLDPAPPMLNIEPTLPMLRIEPALPMDKMEPALPMLNTLPTLSMLPTLPKLKMLNRLLVLNRPARLPAPARDRARFFERATLCMAASSSDLRPFEPV
jgi:hypothetical protein